MNCDAEAKEVKEIVKNCIQCGTCSASCPNVLYMDITPRKMWKMVLSERIEDLLTTRTFILCSSCYYCTLRCPRGLALTRATGLLKQIALKNRLREHGKSTEFYRSFIESVRRHGRVRETEMMTLYFMKMKNPFMPLKFTPVAGKLFMKGKLAIEIPKTGSKPLEKIFKKTGEMEAEA